MDLSHCVLQDKNGSIYEALLNIAYGRDRRILYDITNIRRIDTKKETADGVVSSTQKGRDSHINHGFNDIVSQPDDSVKQYSITENSNGEELSAEQQEYFKDSKVVDELGRLKVMYHGTPNGTFTVFRDGTYFTDNQAYADLYQNPGASLAPLYKAAAAANKTKETYRNRVRAMNLSAKADR